MAISKKSLGKVLAISMASAMAMSSLSAALVSVSAVQDPALASNGQVEFKTDAEDQVVALLGGVDNEVDTIVNNEFDLSGILNDSLYESKLQYTDADGLTTDIDVTKITYRISSGGSYAKINKDNSGDSTLVAQKAGTATLQIKVTGDVELGGDKNNKEVTFTHNITLNVHADKEIGLKAYMGESMLSSDDLNNLAAYNSDSITFKLVSFHKDSNFAAKINPNLQIGADATTQPPQAETPPTDNLVNNAGATEDLLAVVDGKTGAFDADAYSKLNSETQVLKITSQEQAENVVNAVAANKPAVGSALAGLHMDEVPKEGVAGATFDGKTAVLAGENVTGTQKVYFSAKDYTLTGAAAKLLVVDSEAEYTHYNLKTSELAKAASGADTVEIKVYKFSAASSAAPIVLKQSEVTGAEMAKIIAANIDDNSTQPDNPDKPQGVTVGKIEEQLDDILAKASITDADTIAKIKDLIHASPSDENEGVADALKTWNGLVVEAGENTKYTESSAKTYITGEKYTAQNVYVVGDKVYAAANVTVKDAVDGTDKTLYNAGSENATILVVGATNIVAESSGTTQNYWTGAKKLAVVSGKESDATALTDEQLTAAKVVKFDENAGAEYYILDDTDLATSGVKDIFEVDSQDNSTYKIVKDDTTTAIIDGTTNQEVTGQNILTFVGDTNAPYETKGSDAKYYGNLDASSSEADVARARTEVGSYIKQAYAAAKAADGSGGATDPAPEKEIAVLSAVDLKTSKLKSVRFYAGSGAELFDLMAAADQPAASDKIGSGKWEKGTKSNNSKGFAVDTTGESAEMNLYTKGATGNATVKARVDLENGTFDEYVLNIRTVKAVDFGAKDVTVDKDGSKTIMSISPADPDYILGISDLEKKSLSGYELRTTGAVTVENGTVGVIDADGDVTVHGGRTGNIIEAGRVTVDGGATVGDIVDATGDVSVTESSTAGTITTNIDKVKDEIVGMVTVNDATIAGIDANCSVEVKGGEINGSVVADGKIEITSVDEDEDGNLMDVVINGSVISKGKGTAQIIIDNEGDEGKANITIRGDVNARYANVDSDPSVQIGSSNTTGLISVSGAVQGEHIVLGGNGLVTLGAVRAVNEVEHSDEEGVVVDSKLEFQGFNSGINTISNFADVVVSEGTVNVVNPLTTTTLDIQSDTQIVLASMTVEDITGDGNIIVPAGELTVNGNVDDSPVLTLLGDVAVNTVAYHGNRGLTDKFDLGGLTVKAERQTNGVYDYIVSAQELYGVRTVGKNVTVGQGQTKSVTVVADAALPQGASIVWTSDDKEVATVEGNGTTATIKGVDIGAVDVTATIVDANGRDLGYENATFNVEVLYADTSEVTGNGTGTDENELDLDTKKKNMEAGQVYTFMVRGNNDVENISVTSGDTNVATVALANGADSRGALYNITAVADGKTDITVTYQGKTSKIAVKVGGFQLDTSSKKMAPGQVYSVLAKNVPADQAGNVTLAYDNNIVDVVKVNDNYNGRGVLFNVTAKAIGETEVKVTHNGETETMAVNVVENTGRLTLDTASYTMPFGGSYTIGVKVEKNGRQLSGEEVRAMITNGELVVTDSRTGSIVTTEVQANGNVRVTGRQNEGTTYVQFIVMQNGQRVTHASVGVTVQNGATAGGSSVRSISQW